MMNLEKMQEIYLGQEVMLYPNDNNSKYGIIEDINPHGIIIKITEVDVPTISYKVGDVTFISFDNKLTFKLRKKK